jgi:hypothetical protein
MRIRTIQVTNQAATVSPEEALLWTIACADQVRNEFAEAWGFVPPTVSYSPDGSVDPGAFHVLIVDDATQAGLLGYHDEDQEGKPRAFVFAKTIREFGEEPSVTLSHEILELVLDPTCSLWHQAPDGKLRALEACDAVQGDSYVKRVGDTDVRVSNWVSPNYFDATPIAGEPFDYMGKLSRPCPALAPNGYDIVLDTKGFPTQEFAERFASLLPWKKEIKSRSGSRTSRRVSSRDAGER